VLGVPCTHRVVTQAQLARLFPGVPERTLRYRTRRLHELGLAGRSRPYREQGSAPNHHWPTRRADCLMRGEPTTKGGERQRPPRATRLARPAARPLRPRRPHQAPLHHAPPKPRGRAATPRAPADPDLDRAQELLGDFGRLWHAEPNPAERRKLLDHVWQDNGTIVAVNPRPAFARYFKAIEQARPKHPKANRKRGVTNAEATGVEAAFVASGIEIRL
jgi:hypothetical protein